VRLPGRANHSASSLAPRDVSRIYKPLDSAFSFSSLHYTLPSFSLENKMPRTHVVVPKICNDRDMSVLFCPALSTLKQDAGLTCPSLESRCSENCGCKESCAPLHAVGTTLRHLELLGISIYPHLPSPHHTSSKTSRCLPLFKSFCKTNGCPFRRSVPFYSSIRSRSAIFLPGVAWSKNVKTSCL
jgi:hypothetical protein